MTVTETMPFVLHVDDDPDDLDGWQVELRHQNRVQIEVCHPDQVTEASLRKASLILVDFKLERWAQRENASGLALKPVNGLALLSVLQEAAYELDRDNPRAFALFTAVVQDVARGLTPQPHIVARAHNLEWVFDKKAPDIVSRGRRVAELAEAVRSLPQPWPGDSPYDAALALRKWLALPENVLWKDSAWDDVLSCHPPMHEFAEHTHGIGILRWALHRIWPYPTFLLDDAHLAARLRVELVSLRAELETNEQLKTVLFSVQCRGSLESFVGRRWWRAGVESLIFDLASKDPANILVLHDRLRTIAPGLKMMDSVRAFPVFDETFQVRDILGTDEQVAEVIPDDWPPFADSAWILKSDLESQPHLAAIATRHDSQEG